MSTVLMCFTLLQKALLKNGHRIFLMSCGMLIIILSAKSQNVLISDAHHPCEPSIKISNKHPNAMVAGAVYDNCYWSLDSGKTWFYQKLISDYGVYGDPVIDVDTNGFFYYTHLSNTKNAFIDRIVCQRSEDHGKTWTSGSFVGLNDKKAQDKQWSVVNPFNNHLYLTWTQFDKYGSKLPEHKSIILFSKSEDLGKTWSDPIKINEISGDCIDSDETVEGAVPAVGPQGQIYVSWIGPKGLTFNRSLNGGTTWLDSNITIDEIPGGWDFNIPGIIRSNGLPVTKCDLSQSPYRGRIYINWCDQRTDSTDTDVWLSFSDDQGSTWSNPTRVNNDPPGRHQFFTWMDIDQTTGYLYFVFYDRRNHNDNNTDVYLAVSRDGGNNFQNIQISETPFLPTPKEFFGDYINISCHNGIIRPIWTRLHLNKLSIWTHLTNESFLFKESQKANAPTD